METRHGTKYRQLHIEDYLREIPAEQGKVTGVYAHEWITGNPDTNTDFWTDNLLDTILRSDNLNAAYKRVKANKGSAGIDGMDFEKFEKRLNNNLYKIWNRMSSGSYFPSPVMAVEIPKKSGGTRRLGIPTIADRIAQMVARAYVERAVEPMFCEDSYG